MGDGIFHLDSDGRLEPMTVTPYDDEELLHELVLAEPGLLAGAQLNPGAPRRWALVLRGAKGTEGSGRQGVSLFVDQDGVPTLVSVRRAADERSRRDVVGQVLDLVANGLQHWPIEDLRATYETTQRRGGQDPRAVVAKLCADSATTLDEFFGWVETNLRVGLFRILVVADQVPVELVRITELLSEQLSPAEVFAVDVTQYRSADYPGSVIVPAVPRHAAVVATDLGFDERPRSDPATRQLLDRVGELALASDLELVEIPDAVQLRTGSGEVLAVVDLVWDSLDVPMARVPLDDADAAGRMLAGLTHKKLSATTPSVPAHNVVDHWDDVRALLQRLADAPHHNGGTPRG
jgi:hypothetical protein